MSRIITTSSWIKVMSHTLTDPGKEEQTLARGRVCPKPVQFFFSYIMFRIQKILLCMLRYEQNQEKAQKMKTIPYVTQI